MRRFLILVAILAAGCSQASVPSSAHSKDAVPRVTASPSITTERVPAVKGTRLATAKRTLKKLGFHVRVRREVRSGIAPGTVVSIRPSPKTNLAVGSTVVLVVAKAPPNPCLAQTGNPWCYSFFPGSLIDSPPSNFCDYFTCIPSFWDGSGYVVQCSDREFSHSGGRSGACSYHGGEWRPLYSH